MDLVMTLTRGWGRRTVGGDLSVATWSSCSWLP